MNAAESNEFFEESFRPRKVMVILRGMGVTTTLSFANRAWDAGLPLVEVPIQSKEDAATLGGVVAAGALRDQVVGAGTVISRDLVDAAAALGATFTVAPGLDLAVAGRSLELGLPHLAGVASASEVQRAVAAGFEWLKAFPAASLGTGWIEAMAGPFPAVKFVATGGIDEGNAHRFLDAGAGAVSLGKSFGRMLPDDLSAIGAL